MCRIWWRGGCEGEMEASMDIEPMTGWRDR